jgi:hypothetical protein
MPSWRATLGFHNVTSKAERGAGHHRFDLLEDVLVRQFLIREDECDAELRSDLGKHAAVVIGG